MTANSIDNMFSDINCFTKDLYLFTMEHYILSRNLIMFAAGI